MKLLNKEDIIEEVDCLIEIGQQLEKYVMCCKISCIGKHEWKLILPSVYGGYAMLLEKKLINLPDDLFLVYQINEHSRGAHCEYEIHLLNTKGEILFQTTSRHYTEFVLDGKYVWYIQSGDKPYKMGEPDLMIVQLDYKTANEKQKVSLNFRELLPVKEPFIHRVKFVEKNNDCFLEIQYSDLTSEKRNLNVEIPISNFR
ncbi:MAG: hypothetical protein R2780_02795 [Crocinitomicaceae bacterium]|nr:hypothetical protein [Crocinitomicaceae bacterium]